MSAVPAQNSRPSSLLIGSRAEPSASASAETVVSAERRFGGVCFRAYDLQNDMDAAADEESDPLRSWSEGFLDLLLSASTLSGRNLMGTGRARSAPSLGVGGQRQEPADGAEPRR